MALAVSPPSRFCRWHPRASMAYRLLQSRLIWGLTSPVPYITFLLSHGENIQRFFSPPTRPKKEAAHKMALDMESVRERDWLAVWGITNIRPAKNEIGEKTRPTVGNRIFTIFLGVSGSTYGPTSTHLMSFEIIKEEDEEF